MFDLHTHTTMTDGELIPTELVRRMAVTGYDTVAITDHADYSNYKYLIDATSQIKKSSKLYGVRLIAGVELTHVPPEQIDELAQLCKKAGAEIVVVHGETTTEPVTNGTNLASCKSDYVDVLAHPGFITEEEAKEAYRHNIAIEITARGGHNRTNGHVLSVAKKCGCLLTIDSDAHSPDDIMSESMRRIVGMGAGMGIDEVDNVLSEKNLSAILNI